MIKSNLVVSMSNFRELGPTGHLLQSKSVFSDVVDCQTVWAVWVFHLSSLVKESIEVPGA